ncbi:MAG TPA: tRNA (adenosine(37)-N6)-threonylcarbamoyltransferase complex transferase subunit TsaD [Lysobacter sp.]
MLADIVHSQLAVHQPFGGVVPEIAARAHLDLLDTIVERALGDAGLGFPDLDGVAVAGGPGLIGGVMVGTTMAKAFALVCELPFIAVNHIEGHALTARLSNAVEFPYLLLLVSGGHCQLVIVRGVGRYTRLGTTIDDAAGEAFDKTAKMMDLPYPGGPQLAALAEQGRPGIFKFARPMTDRPGLDFSFSGLKTQVLLAWRDSDRSAQTRADIARAFEDAVVDTLAIKCERALDATGFDTLVIAGGVGANKRLRAKLQAMAEKRGGRVSFPRPMFCTDNGAMIAYAGALRLQAGQHSDAAVRVTPRWDMATLPPLGEASP